MVAIDCTERMDKTTTLSSTATALKLPVLNFVVLVLFKTNTPIVVLRSYQLIIMLHS